MASSSKKASEAASPLFIRLTQQERAQLESLQRKELGVLAPKVGLAEWAKLKLLGKLPQAGGAR